MRNLFPPSNFRYVQIILLFRFPLCLLVLVKFLLDFLFRKPSRLGSQHVGQLLLRHANLISNWHHTVSQVQIVLGQNSICHHQVVDIPKDEGSPVGVFLLCLEESSWVILPVTQRVQVMRSMPSIIEAVSVTLYFDLVSRDLTIFWMRRKTYRYIDQCDARSEVRSGVNVVNKSMLTIVANH